MDVIQVNFPIELNVNYWSIAHICAMFNAIHILFPFEKVVFPFCVNRNPIHCTFMHPSLSPFRMSNVIPVFFCDFQQLIYKFLVSVRLYIFKGKRENAKTFSLRYVW